jgi:hypothetical protein
MLVLVMLVRPFVSRVFLFFVVALLASKQAKCINIIDKPHKRRKEK